MLVLGLGTYGRSFTLSNPSSHDVGSSFTGPGLPGEFTQDGGILAYYEVNHFAPSNITAWL